MPVLLGDVFKLTNNQPPLQRFKDINLFGKDRLAGVEDEIMAAKAGAQCTGSDPRV